MRYAPSRRSFFKLATGAVLSAVAGPGRGAFAWPRGACITFFHLADTRLGSADHPSGHGSASWLGHQAQTLAEDLLFRGREDFPEPVSLLVHTGNLLGAPRRSAAEAAQAWLRQAPWPARLTVGDTDTGTRGLSRSEFRSLFSAVGFFSGRTYYAYELSGFRFIHLDAGNTSGPDSSSRLYQRQSQLYWLKDQLEPSRQTPVILVLHPPLLPPDSRFGPGLNEWDRRALTKLVQAYPQVVLVLGGKILANTAAFLPGASALCLTTAAPAAYPCGARLIRLRVVDDHRVLIQAEFIQTRRLELVEESFQAGEKNLARARLGDRLARGLTAEVGSRLSLEPLRFAVNPALAPWWSSAASLSLAVVSDTHLCRGDLVSDSARKDNRLIGHYEEPESQQLLDDILEQVISGRHRVEFFDEVFARDPQADRHFLTRPVDALLLCGDLAEHGRLVEAEQVRTRLQGLPRVLRERTLVAFGNHDLFKGEFAPKGSASRKQSLGEFYAGFGVSAERSYYAVPLTEWLTLLVLDSTIPTHSGLGLLQEQIDWLEDEILARPHQAVVVASHHPLYPITLVPEVMEAYLRHRSHFTPPVSAARSLTQSLFGRLPQVKLVLSGHYHGVCVDQFRKPRPAGSAADDGFTTHVQVPCTIEYPCGYTLFRFIRQGGVVRTEYQVAYTRLADLRRRSGQAPMYRLMGAKIQAPRRYEGTLARLSRRDHLFRALSAFQPLDLADLDLRGFKDGSARGGRGNTGKGNLNGKLEFSIS